MKLYEALYTTRAMRRLKPDPIPREVQARILDAAIRAPSGSNAQRWRFLLVDDPEQIRRIAEIYRVCMQLLWETPAYAEQIAAAKADPEGQESRESMRLVNSAQYLADHFHEVPLLLFAFSQADTSGGSIFPSVWSAMLAARAEGVGSCLTTILAFRRDEVYALLGVPADEGWQMACCVTFGYPTGPWGVAARQPAHEVAFQNRWGEPLGYEIPEPLWTKESQ
jgi:nitroreductase